jgi:DNA-binding PadR family transcriptional regulator
MSNCNHPSACGVSLVVIEREARVPTNIIIGEFEQLVLLCLLQLGDDAHAIALRERVSAAAGRSIARGALYRTLDRLEEKGWLDWTVEASGPERGGHARRRFRVTPRGVATLRASRDALEQLWQGLDEVIG